MTDAPATEPDYTLALGKPPTSLQRRFADFIMSEEVGYSPATAKTKEEAFREGVRLGVALRIPFQASNTNRIASAEEREARQAELAEEVRIREEERAARAAAPPAEKPTPAKAAPAKAAPAKAAPAKKAAAKKTAAPAAAPAAAPPAARPAARRAPARRAPAASAAPVATEAPF